MSLSKAASAASTSKPEGRPSGLCCSSLARRAPDKRLVVQAAQVERDAVLSSRFHLLLKVPKRLRSSLGSFGACPPRCCATPKSAKTFMRAVLALRDRSTHTQGPPHIRCGLKLLSVLRLHDAFEPKVQKLVVAERVRNGVGRQATENPSPACTAEFLKCSPRDSLQPGLKATMGLILVIADQALK